MTNDYARGYRNGFRDGRKSGEAILKIGEQNDFALIYSAFLAVLHRKGWDEDALLGIVNEINEWLQEHNTLNAKEMLAAASDEIGFEVRLNEDE